MKKDRWYRGTVWGESYLDGPLNKSLEKLKYYRDKQEEIEDDLSSKINDYVEDNIVEALHLNATTIRADCSLVVSDEKETPAGVCIEVWFGNLYCDSIIGNDNRRAFQAYDIGRMIDAALADAPEFKPAVIAQLRGIADRIERGKRVAPVILARRRKAPSKEGL